MRQVNKAFDEIKFYGIFGLIVVALVFYIVFWGTV